MAWGFQDKEDKDLKENPYSGMLNENINTPAQMDMHNTQAMQSQAADTQAHDTGFGNGAGSPNETSSGYLNFSDFANANAGTAKGMATKLGKSTVDGATAAQNALGGRTAHFEVDATKGTVKPSQATKTGGEVATEERGTADQEAERGPKVVKAGTPDTPGTVTQPPPQGPWGLGGTNSTTTTQGPGGTPTGPVTATNPYASPTPGTTQGPWGINTSNAPPAATVTPPTPGEAGISSQTAGLGGESTRPGSNPVAEAEALGEDRLADQRASDPGDARAQDISTGYDQQVVDAQKTLMDAQQNDPEYWKKMKDAQYSGPSSLSEGEGWNDLLAQTDTAQGNIDALQAQHNGDVNSGIQASMPGSNKWDAAAVGAFGRPQFAQIGEKYGKSGLQGDLKNQLNAAVRGTHTMGRQAREESEKNAAGYGKLLDDYDASNKSAADAKAGEKARTEGDVADTDRRQKRLDQFHKLGDHTPAGDFARFHEMIDPLAWLFKGQGMDTPEEQMNAGIEGAAGVEPGQSGSSASGDVWHGDDTSEALLYENMTDDEEAEFDALPTNQAKRDWIEAHKGKYADQAGA